MHKSVGEQWQELCDEDDAARGSFFKAFSAVNAKFAAVGASRSNKNPTDDELSQFESTWKSCQEVKGRMDDFVKNHA